MVAEILSANKQAYEKARRLLSSGDVVALLTETVYGLAARADNTKAVAKIYKIKNRRKNNPLTICVSSIKQAQMIAEISPLAHKLMRGFWPGPLTLVLPLKAGAPICATASAGLGTIGLRIPDADWVQHFDAPLVLPSANTSGQTSPRTAQEVAADLGDKIPLIIDGGPCKLGVDSTVISIESGKAKLLRAGAVTAEDFAPYSIEWLTA